MTDIGYAERALVGATLRAPDTLRETSSLITEASFASPILGAVYETACALWTAGNQVDAITVDAALRERGQRGIDGLELFSLVEGTPHTSNAAHYARIVSEAATKRALGAAGVRLQQLASIDLALADVMAAARGEWEALSRTGSSALEARSLGALLAEDDAPHDWLIPDLLERRDRLMLTGGEGGGKTTFMRQIAICAAAGVHPTTFRTINPVRVLVVDAENNRRQWRRQAAKIAGAATRYGADPSQNMHLVTVEDMPKGRLIVTDPRDAAAVHRLIDQHTPDLLVIGPMYKLTNRAITSDDDAAPLITALDGFRGRGVTLAIEAHAGHATSGATGERDLRPRGSSALLGWPEFGFGLRRKVGASVDPRDEYRQVDVVRWRGDRETGRKWPTSMYADPRNAFPWTDEQIPPASSRQSEEWVA